MMSAYYCDTILAGYVGMPCNFELKLQLKFKNFTTICITSNHDDNNVVLYL